MKRGEITSSIPEETAREIKAALDKVNLVDGVWQSIVRLRQEEKTQLELLRVNGENAEAKAPEGYLFTVDAGENNTFNLSEYRPDLSNIGFALTNSKTFEPEDPDSRYFFVANRIANGIESTGSAVQLTYAYSPDGKIRCLLGEDSLVGLVPINELPQLLVNPDAVPLTSA